jgi:hypothetical protein
MAEMRPGFSFLSGTLNRQGAKGAKVFSIGGAGRRGPHRDFADAVRINLTFATGPQDRLFSRPAAP